MDKIVKNKKISKTYEPNCTTTTIRSIQCEICCCFLFKIFSMRGCNDVSDRRRAAFTWSRFRYLVLIAVMEENVFSQRYVVAKVIKSFKAFSLRIEYSSLTEIQNCVKGIDLKFFSRVQSVDNSMRFSFSFGVRFMEFMFALNGIQIQTFPGRGSSSSG